MYFSLWNNVTHFGSGTVVRGLGVSLPQLLKECGVNIHDFLNKIFHVCQILSSPKEMLTSLYNLKQNFANLNKDIGDFDFFWKQLKSLRSKKSDTHTDTLNKELAWHLHLLLKGSYTFIRFLQLFIF